MARSKRQIPPAHPGEILDEEFLKPLGMTINALALALRVPSNRLYAIVEGERGISPDTALRLGRYFGTGRLGKYARRARRDSRTAGATARARGVTDP